MSVLGARRDKLSQRDAGFTLVELIVAMLVMAIVLIAIITVQARALTTNADSQARQEATALGNEAMEELRATPWNYLQKGLYSGFEAKALAATGAADPFGAGSTRTFNGDTFNLRVAPADVNDQNLAEPWVPLFDANGSNARLLTSPSGNSNTFVVRAYVTEDTYASTGAVGLVVVVSWTKKTDGSTSHTVITSTAFSPAEGGCGDPSTSPFLASCQAMFDATATSSGLVMSATATSADGTTPAPLNKEATGYSLQMVTASTSARATSLQVSKVEGYASFGGVTWDDNLDSTKPSDFGRTAGYTSYSLTADDDVTSTVYGANASQTFGFGVNSEILASSGAGVTARSDDTRSPFIETATTSSCSTGIGALDAGTACAHASIGSNGQDTGYADMSIFGSGLRLTRVEHTSGSTSADDAWAARFSTNTGTAVSVCTTVTGSGCIASGAQQRLGTVTIGKVISGNWDGAGAPNGLVVISGYSDSAKVARGVNQTGANAWVTRGASISYWTGSSYVNLPVTDGTTALVPLGDPDDPVIPMAVWTLGDGTTVTAVGEIVVTGSDITQDGSAPCKGTDVCTGAAENGSITVTISYAVAPADGTTPWVLTVKTTINGSTASASFKESPSV